MEEKINKKEKVQGVRLVNLTPHKIVIFDEQGNIVTVLEPSGKIARVKTEQVIVREINGIQVVKTKFTEVEGLPEPREDTIYVVSSLVAQAIQNRKDVVAPDTSPSSVVRDKDGRIIGVRRFQCFSEVE